MRYAISIPQFYADGEFDPAAFRAYCSRVEELGYASGWTQESVLSSGPQLGPIETMAYAAACTQRLRLGCVVFVSTLHSPVHLAKSMASLDQLSGGRIDVGVGTGGKQRPFAAFGMTGDRYVARFTEGVNVMKALWTQDRVTFDGEFWQLKDAAMEPKPVQKPHPPILVGGAFPQAARRAVRYGDGWAPIAGRGPDSEVVELLPRFRQMLSEAGRDPQSVPVTLFGVTEDADRLARYRDKGIARVVVMLPSAKSDAILPTLDRWAELIRRVG